MRIDQIKQKLTIQEVLAYLCMEPDRRKSSGFDLWYLSPMRPGETVPSFHIHAQKDIWFDFGSGQGGDLIDFAKVYTKGTTQIALAWLRGIIDGNQISTSPPRCKSHHLPPVSTSTKSFVMVENAPLSIKSLLKNLDERKISRKITSQYLRQIKYLPAHRAKLVYGFGFANRSGGIDFSNPLGFKSCLGKKDISFLPGQSSSRTLEVFEGFMDYLTRLTLEGKATLENDTVVLNSTSMARELVELVLELNYARVLLWLDNDQAGHTATEFVEKALSGPGIAIVPMNKIYLSYKDLNQWHMDIELPFESKKSTVDTALKNSMSNPEWMANSFN